MQREKQAAAKHQSSPKEIIEDTYHLQDTFRSQKYIDKPTFTTMDMTSKSFKSRSLSVNKNCTSSKLLPAGDKEKKIELLPFTFSFLP